MSNGSWVEHEATGTGQTKNMAKHKNRGQNRMKEKSIHTPVNNPHSEEKTIWKRTV